MWEASPVPREDVFGQNGQCKSCFGMCRL
jgi:hypothetical protein